MPGDFRPTILYSRHSMCMYIVVYMYIIINTNVDQFTLRTNKLYIAICINKNSCHPLSHEYTKLKFDCMKTKNTKKQSRYDCQMTAIK